jgi:hypothetical protein
VPERLASRVARRQAARGDEREQVLLGAPAPRRGARERAELLHPHVRYRPGAERPHPACAAPARPALDNCANDPLGEHERDQRSEYAERGEDE